MIVVTLASAVSCIFGGSFSSKYDFLSEISFWFAFLVCGFWVHEFVPYVYLCVTYAVLTGRW
jgi:hypothetical protein